MKNLPLEVEDHIISYLFTPLIQRKRSCALTNHGNVCKHSAKNKIFCNIHENIFKRALKSSNVFESVYVKSKYLRRNQKI